MSNYYVANANGDWWKVEDKEGATLFVIGEDDLLGAVNNEDPYGNLEISEVDKLERYIRDYGKEIELIAPNQFQEGAKYVLAELATIYSGITETDLWAEFFGEEQE